ncbi:putative alpha-1-antitrypsin-related protein [Octodon degus]|uniref:Alpha-1-antitrypsin-related protein n=1 Tax=Octodon degus TaxID=10160 RepID=A0A6P6ET29_OCTDE|nr:putative alpha-1-antitrypsin-related protein [Octodon degus]
MGSSLFIHESLKPVDQFLQDTEELYHAGVISINFTDAQVARNQINSRVKMETHGEIADLVSDLQEGTTLALANYICFHGKLHEELLQELIAEANFQVHKKRAIIVPMVHRLGRFYVQWYPRLSSWVLVQHYVSDTIAFFIMPNLGKMQQLQQRLTRKHLDAIQRHTALRFVHLFFPKLSISGAHDLKSLLGTLGITKVFSSAADLSGVTEEAPLKLSKAVHRVQVTLDEKTEDTEVDEENETLWLSIPTISFNRSFLVIIKDEFTNFPLLVGRVRDPTQH